MFHRFVWPLGVIFLFGPGLLSTIEADDQQGGKPREKADSGPTAAKSVASRLAQVFPDHAYDAKLVRSRGQGRAVLLIHGLRPQLNPDVAEKLPKGVRSLIEGPDSSFARAEFSDWQRFGSPLVSYLSKSADVFAFAYGQVVALEKIADEPALAAGVGQLKALGYAEIVLLGHSAGGVLARLFVEDHPGAGVTKVIQVCAPNGGSFLAGLKVLAPRGQEAFMKSLSVESRRASNLRRQQKKIPAAVQFVCVVAKKGQFGDGAVTCACQWPDDLQCQGIPAIELATNHYLVMSQENWVKRLAQLVTDEHPRWNKEQVQAFKRLVGEEEFSRGGYVAMVQSVAGTAARKGDVPTLVECGYALAPFDSPAKAKEPLPCIFLRQAAHLILARNNQLDARRFLELLGAYQSLLSRQIHDRLIALACGKKPDEVLKGEVAACLGSLRQAGPDFFDPDIVTRGGDREVAAALGKALVLAARPTARVDRLAGCQIDKQGKAGAAMEIEMNFWHGTARYRATIKFHVSQDKNRVRLADVVYQDDALVPWDRDRLAELMSRFNNQ
jgi:pimeloyl-ACP methyl ester carboxylesterase